MKRKNSPIKKIVSIPSREKICDVLKAASSPVSFEQILELLKIQDDAKEQALLNRISAMLRDGEVVSDDYRYSINKNSQAQTVSGIVLSKDDDLFLQPDDGKLRFIPAHIARHLFIKDRIKLRLVSKDNQANLQIVSAKVLERRKTIIGKFSSFTQCVTSSTGSINQKIMICGSRIDDLSDGSTVVVQLKPPEFLGQPLEGEIIKKCRYADDTDREIHLVTQKFDLPDYWEARVLDEAKSYSKNVARIPDEKRKDLREKLFVTIDGQDAKDFDDAILTEKIDEKLHLFVAIADVASYVPVGGAVDKEAYTRGNSVYFPSKVIPMLPQVLSNKMCSLQPNQDRLALVCEMVLDQSGEMKEYQFYPAVIQSKARLTYTQVADFLNNKNRNVISVEIGKMLRLAHQTWRTLDNAKIKRKAMQLNIPTTRIIFNNKKEALRIELYERNEAHQLIEEFMICANVAAAKFLAHHKTPYLRRVHQGLKQGMLEKFNAFLQQVGFTVSGETQDAFCQLFDKIKGHKNEDLIHRAVLKCLARALYAPLDTGHFGLALTHYTHFTSPIRRYSDLLVHRAIYSVLDKNSDNKISQNLLSFIGEHCSTTERLAENATRDIDSYLKCKLLQKSIGKSFNSTVTSVTDFGLFVELEGVFTDALIHISRLGNSYYMFDEKNQTLRSENGKEVFRFGMPIRVKIIQVDSEKRRIDAVPLTNV